MDIAFLFDYGIEIVKIVNLGYEKSLEPRTKMTMFFKNSTSMVKFGKLIVDKEIEYQSIPTYNGLTNYIMCNSIINECKWYRAKCYEIVDEVSKVGNLEDEIIVSLQDVDPVIQHDQMFYIANIVTSCIDIEVVTENPDEKEAFDLKNIESGQVQLS